MAEDIFDEKKEDKKPNPVFRNKKKVIVAGINKKKGIIILNNNGNGESIDYIEERHSNLKIGDSIEI